MHGFPGAGDSEDRTKILRRGGPACLPESGESVRNLLDSRQRQLAVTQTKRGDFGGFPEESCHAGFFVDGSQALDHAAAGRRACERRNQSEDDVELESLDVALPVESV